MCDYDYGWRPIREKTVKTRKPQECNACGDTFPAGSLLRSCTGTWEGELETNYYCAVCDFAALQGEDSLLHICLGDMQSASKWDEMHWIHPYIKAHLAVGRRPTQAGAAVYLAGLRAADELDQSRDTVPLIIESENTK